MEGGAQRFGVRARSATFLISPLLAEAAAESGASRTHSKALRAGAHRTSALPTVKFPGYESPTYLERGMFQHKPVRCIEGEIWNYGI